MGAPEVPNAALLSADVDAKGCPHLPCSQMRLLENVPPALALERRPRSSCFDWIQAKLLDGLQPRWPTGRQHHLCILPCRGAWCSASHTTRDLDWYQPSVSPQMPSPLKAGSAASSSPAGEVKHNMTSCGLSRRLHFAP